MSGSSTKNESSPSGVNGLGEKTSDASDSRNNSSAVAGATAWETPTIRTTNALGVCGGTMSGIGSTC